MFRFGFNVPLAAIYSKLKLNQIGKIYISKKVDDKKIYFFITSHLNTNYNLFNSSVVMKHIIENLPV